VEEYLRDQVLMHENDPSKTEIFAAVEAELRAHDTPGPTREEILGDIHELRGD
jgi:hypothetical protein